MWNKLFSGTNPRTWPVKAMSVAVLAMGLTLGGSPSAQSQTVDELYTAAKAEGTLVLWTPFDTDAMRIMADAFEAEYPGVKVEHFELQSGAAVQRIIAEAQAGRTNFDLIHANVPYTKPLLDRDLLQPYDWSAAGIDKELLLYDNKCIDYHHLDIPIAYNTSMVKEGEITSWDDLLNPKWKGKVVLEARGFGLSILLKKWGEDKTGKFIDGLKENGALVLQGGTPTAEALAGGQAAFAIGTYSGKMIQYKENGAPVEWARVGPIPVQDYLLCVPRKAAHPNAARLFAQWATTKPGQDSLWKGQRYGRLTGENLSPVGQEVKDKNIEVIVEDRDPVASQARQAWVSKRIGGL